MRAARIVTLGAGWWVSLGHGATGPSEIPEDWFLTNDMKVQARAAVNRLAGRKRIKNAIFGGNSARLYNFTPQQRAGLADDKIASYKDLYNKRGAGRTNFTYGYSPENTR